VIAKFSHNTGGHRRRCRQWYLFWMNSTPRFLRFFAILEAFTDGEDMAASNRHIAESAVSVPGRSLSRRQDERVAVEAIIRGLIRALNSGWSLEASQPERSYRGLWGKTFVRFFSRDARSA